MLRRRSRAERRRLFSNDSGGALRPARTEAELNRQWGLLRMVLSSWFANRQHTVRKRFRYGSAIVDRRLLFDFAYTILQLGGISFP